MLILLPQNAQEPCRGGGLAEGVSMEGKRVWNDLERVSSRFKGRLFGVVNRM
jgi:hypothetical protein